MSNLKRNANRFLYQHRNKGIPNLMLYVSVGNLVVYLVSLILMTRNIDLYALLSFNAKSILSGQVWRLFTYPFTTILGDSFLFFKLLLLYFYYWIGKALESSWGTLRLNLYYFSGLLLMDLAGILLYVFASYGIVVDASYINMSLFLAVATLLPEHTVLLFMIIPIKMRWMALVDVALTAYEVVLYVLTYSSFVGGTLAGVIIFGVAPQIALINYFLFFGRNVKNLFGTRRVYRTPPKRPEPKAQPNPDWAKNYRSASGERPYRHKCTVCGRTDTDCPDLEFRYCSKCAGYFCYCIDHINNHTHVQ